MVRATNISINYLLFLSINFVCVAQDPDIGYIYKYEANILMLHLYQ